MNVELMIEVWTKQAIANYYKGFLVIENETKGLDRIFIENEEDIYHAKNSGVKIIQEVYV